MKAVGTLGLAGPSSATTFRNSTVSAQTRRVREARFGPSFGSKRRSALASCAVPNPLAGPSSSLGSVSSTLPGCRSFMSSSLDDDQDDSSYLNAICYPDAVLDEPHDEINVGSGSRADSAACVWPVGLRNPGGDLDGVQFSDFVGYAESVAPQHSLTSADEAEDSAFLSRQAIWRHGAAAAVLRAEDNYRKAWQNLQLAEQRLLSTRKVAAELDALPAGAFPHSQSEQSVDIPVLPSVARSLTEPGNFHPGELSTGLPIELAGPPGSHYTAPVDLEWDDGVWCIEACATEPESPSRAGEIFPPSSSALHDLSDAEGAIAQSREALDKAARDLISRLEEEEDLQGQLIDRHIEALDRGGQHQVARWLVDEMDALASGQALDSLGKPPGCDGPVVGKASELGLSVPLDLDLAMKGSDEHALRFLRHLPYDQVLKIRTIPPSPEAKTLGPTMSAAEKLERILSQPAGQPANERPQELVDPRGSLSSSEIGVPGMGMAVDESGSGAVALLGEKPLCEGLGFDQSALAPGSNPAVLDGGHRRKGKVGRYHSKLVLLGCCVSSLAAYMVANFELMVLAKDVAVILTAMSLAFIAAQFVWRNGGGSDLSDDEEGGLETLRTQKAAAMKSLPPGAQGMHSPVGSISESGLIRGRGPSWDQVIWLLGGFAVVLSLSTMIALACKAAQAMLTALSMFACSIVVKVLPLSSTSAATAALASTHSAPALVRHVSTSLWLVLGGELLSSGVETLGSAAAWAMLLLCVAFSIASAPVCIASSTSRTVSELLALARSGSSEPGKCGHGRRKAI